MLRLFPAIAAAMFATSGLAQHAAHVHGTGMMNLALEGDVLSIDLIAPAHDLVGFEHKPSDDADRAALATAREALLDGTALLGIPSAAGCNLTAVDLHSALLESGEGGGHAKENAGDDHGKETDSAGHDDDDHRHDAERGDEEAHSEFRAEYRFACSNPDALEALDLRYFKVFPRATELRVQGITDAGQILVRLTRDNQRLTMPD